MKKIKSYIGIMLMLVTALFSSCSPDSFEGADPNAIPSLKEVEPVITVDQSINQVTFSLPENTKGVMPIWIFYTNKGTANEKIAYSTVNGLKRIFTKAGDYECEFKLMNRNGVSEGTKSFKFHIDNSIVNYDKYYTLLCGGKGAENKKEWRIDNEKRGHLACGPAGTTGMEWWAAAADEKKDFGVYDNRMTFSGNDKYTFDPGTSGTMYVNKGVAALGGGPDVKDDFTVPATAQTTDFQFDTVGDDLYIVFPANTQFPYIANGEIWAEPRYKVESITNQEINLVSDNGSIAWHYILTTKDPNSGGGDKPTADWDASSSANLWKAVEDGSAFISVTPWFANDGWQQIADPQWTHADGVWEITIPEGIGTSQWQGQFPINTKLTAAKNKKYNFYCVVESEQDAPGITIKLTETDDPDGTKHDGNFFVTDRHAVKAFEPFVYKAEGVQLATNDAHALSLVFDFGGTPAGTKVKISKIYFEEATSLSYDDADNMWKGVDGGEAFISVTPWFANDGWQQIADPQWEHNGNKWDITIPEGIGSSQWQGQFAINTKLTAATADEYTFSCTIEADNNAPGVTVKLTETDDPDGTKHDSNFFFDNRHEVKAFTPFVYTAKNVKLPKNDAHALTLVFDFGGTPAGTKISITNIIFKKVSGAAPAKRNAKRARK